MSNCKSAAEYPARVDPSALADDKEQEFDDEVAAIDADQDSDMLSEVDEDQYEDYDPDTANIEDRPVDINEDVARTLRVSKRKRVKEQARKSREGRREEERKYHDNDANMEKFLPAKRDNEVNLAAEERRKRAIDMALDAAIINRGSLSTRQRKNEIDLEDEIDEQLADLIVQMENACHADNEARHTGQPAVHKLKLLLQVNAILNRNNIQHAILDPDTNFLLRIKYFIEPLSDGSLPAYNIQHDLFTALTKLDIEKEALESSGIGKIILFYTKSEKPELNIKRMAERLLREWSRPMLKRTDDFKKRHIETRKFDYHAAELQQRHNAVSKFSATQRPAQTPAEVEMERLLAPSGANNQARMASLPSSYSIAPMTTFDGSRAQDHRPPGASGMEAFRKMTQKSKK